MSQKKRKQNWLEEANNAELENAICWREERDKSVDEQEESSSSNKV